MQIHEDQRDPYLKYKLLREAQGILKWAVDGCLMWKREGLKKPESVQAAISDYRNEMDVINAFMEECIVEGPGGVQAGQLYKAYVNWAEENNEYVMSGTKFGKEMGKKKKKTHSMAGWMYSGILLKPDAVPYQIKFGAGK